MRTTYFRKDTSASDHVAKLRKTADRHLDALYQIANDLEEVSSKSSSHVAKLRKTADKHHEALHDLADGLEKAPRGTPQTVADDYETIVHGAVPIYTGSDAGRPLAGQQEGAGKGKGRNLFAENFVRIKRETKQRQEYLDKAAAALRKPPSARYLALQAEIDAEDEREERLDQERRRRRRLQKIDNWAAIVAEQEAERVEVATVRTLEKQHEQIGWMDSEIARDAVLQKAREERAAQLARLAPRR